MKTNKTIFVLACCLLGLGSPFHAFGWDNPGHMAVAGLAYDELTPTQQQRLAAILRQHPALDLLTDGFPDGTLDDRELVMAAATWPDMAKRAKAKGYKDNGYEENDPAVTEVKFDSNDKKMHKGYHFIDTPLWLGQGAQPALPAVPKVNAVGVVTVLKTQLQSNESDPAKAYDLGWLLHLTGDLHQPLHAVTGVTPTNPKGDTGGNAITVKGVTNGLSDLHSFWDDVLAKSAPSDPHTHHPRLDRDIAAAEEIIASVHNLHLGANPDSVDPSVWADESFKMAKRDTYDFQLEVVHDEHKDVDKLEVTLDQHYLDMTRRDAKKRIRLAGHRLAVLLKQLLGV